MLKFTVRGIPVPQERPYVVGHRAFDRPKSKKAKKEVAWVARTTFLTHKTGLGPSFEGRVSIHLKFYGARRNADLDNLSKLAIDGMAGVLYKNDNQIDHLDAWRLESSKDEARTEIEVMELL